MLSLQEANGLDLDVMGSGFGFTPWGPDTCPSFAQLMAPTTTPTSSSSPCSSAGDAAEACGMTLEEEEAERRRRQRRKASNRLSARRSRARKQQRLEELRGTAAQLRAQKRELAARLGIAARHELAARRDNARLRAEFAALARRYREARRTLALQRLAQQLRSRARPVLQPAVGGSGVAPAFVPGPGAAMGLASLMT
ncbi:ocs element-binding factor 1-like [Lolium rigidum]|uniref:ocs element-binding factor 1-like n=1 Tax=Lolium rigidum TaxID=89674 RepID=UPI001F5D8E68|nr:ocs element-binding factor 1-like [Lolium rigidum]